MSEKIPIDYENIPYKPTWEHRRRLVAAVTIFCFGGMGYIIYQNSDSSIAETAFIALTTLLVTVVNGYIFGATMDSKAMINAVTTIKEAAIKSPDTVHKSSSSVG